MPIPEPLRFLEPRETETRKMHALEEYGLMHVKLYEDIARHGHIATTYAYPVKVEDRYVMDPSPIPKFDNPKLDAIAGAATVRRRPRKAHLRGAALHQGDAASISRTIPFEVPSERTITPCAAVRRRGRYLDEVILDDAGRADVRLLGYRLLQMRRERRAVGTGRAAAMFLERCAATGRPLLLFADVSVSATGLRIGSAAAVSFDLWPGRGDGRRR